MIVKESVKGTNSLQIDMQAQDHSSTFKDYACFIHIGKAILKFIWKCEEKKRKEKRNWRDLSVCLSSRLFRKTRWVLQRDRHTDQWIRKGAQTQTTRMRLTDSRERHRNNSEEEIQIFFPPQMVLEEVDSQIEKQTLIETSHLI